MLNVVTLQGNLVDAPEIHYTADNLPICSARLACNNKRGKSEETLFIDVTIFGKSGEAFHKFMERGRQVIVEGRLRTDSWKDRDTGAPRSKIAVVANGWHFVGNSKKED